MPLCDRSAARLVLALLADCPRQRLVQIAELLQSDAALALWSVCRAPNWLHNPPTSWSELANWFDAYALDDLSRVIAAEEDLKPDDIRQAKWTNLAQGSPDFRGIHDPISQMTVLLGNAAQWLSQSGPEVTDEVLCRETNWFPRWLASANSVDSAGRSHHDLGRAILEPAANWAAPTSADVELSRRLPAVINKLQRLRRLETEFAAVLEREKIESVRQLAYGAGHEINNPLANIATRAQTLMRDEPDPERRRKLATIVSQTFRAHEMISDLMLFARPPALILTTWDVAELLREIHSEMLTDAQQQRTQIRVNAQQGITINADRTQIAVAVKALVRNALEAIVQGGWVELSSQRDQSTTERDQQILVTVRDSGPGISAESRAHIFDPFYSGREAGRGLGFGLPKCWRIVTSHSGCMSVESEPGRGASLTIQLPASPQPESLRRADAQHDLPAPHKQELEGNKRK